MSSQQQYRPIPLPAVSVAMMHERLGGLLTLTAVGIDEAGACANLGPRRRPRRPSAGFGSMRT